MEMEKKTGKSNKNLYICALLAVFMAGMIFCTLFIPRTEPAGITGINPERTMMLAADSVGSSTDEENTDEDTEKNEEQKPEEPEKEEQPEQQEQPDEEPVEPPHQQEQKPEKEPVREVTEENKTESENVQQPGGQNTTDNGGGSGEDSTSAENSNDENDGESGAEGLTDTIYFTTSIKNGESVTSKAYSFSINHKIENLKPKETNIFINGELAESITDARTEFDIFLNEGENVVRVQVTYENEHGQLLSPYKNYVIDVDTRSLVINTSLADEQTVDSAYLTFTASAAFGEEDVDLLVMQDGEEVFRNDGVYEVYLQEGANTFVMSAEYSPEINAEKTCVVNYVPSRGMYIETDLENQTIKAVEPDFTFRAEVVDGTARTEFTVTLNNKIITGENGVYNIQLQPQSVRAYNTIRLKATDGNEEDSLSFQIKYIPVATPDTEPQVTYINIKDGQTINKKNPFKLEMAAKDYKGNKIYFDGMEVYLNDNHQILRDTKPYVTYYLNFEEGQNEVKILLTDDDGREKEYTYIINYVPPDENQKIGTVTVSMDAAVLGLGSLIPPVKVDLLAGDNLAKVINRAMEAKGYTPVYTGSTDSGYYLKAVGRSGIGSRCNIPEALKNEITEYGIPWHGSAEEPERAANTLGDDDYTAWSGWLVILDGEFISTSAADLDPVDGSIIKIRYTLAYGMDIGDSYQGMTFENTY